MNNGNKRRSTEKAFDSKLPGDFSAHDYGLYPSIDRDASFESKFFECQNEMLQVVAKRVGFDLSMITIQFRQASTNVSDRTLYEVSCCISRALYSSLRKTDQVFKGLKNNLRFSVVLPGTHIDNINVVIDKIRNNMQNTETGFSDEDFLFSYEPLHMTEAV